MLNLCGFLFTWLTPCQPFGFEPPLDMPGPASEYPIPMVRTQVQVAWANDTG
jgi:hypothetical protein